MFWQLELAASLAEAANLDVFTQLQVVVVVVVVVVLVVMVMVMVVMVMVMVVMAVHLDPVLGVNLHRKQDQALQRLRVRLLHLVICSVLLQSSFCLVTATKKANQSWRVKNLCKLLLHTCPSKATTSAPKQCDTNKSVRFCLQNC
jgi:hypothetical protein